ncbi:aminoacyl-tRNA hydrolase [Patescibacteria group bacterium]
MKILIGLGNPGSKYEKSRHNLGYMIVEALAKELQTPFSMKSNLHALVAEGRIGKEKIILAKPTTFMNLTGNAVNASLQYYKANPSDVWIIHDDIDLAFGKLKIHHGRSSAGHRGVENIIQILGTKDFYRFRIGIDSRTDKQRKGETNKFVMANFSRDDKKKLDELIPQVVETVIKAIQTSPEKAMSVWGK